MWSSFFFLSPYRRHVSYVVRPRQCFVICLQSSDDHGHDVVSYHYGEAAVGVDAVSPDSHRRQFRCLIRSTFILLHVFFLFFFFLDVSSTHGFNGFRTRAGSCAFPFSRVHQLFRDNPGRFVVRSKREAFFVRAEVTFLSNNAGTNSNCILVINIKTWIRVRIDTRLNERDTKSHDHLSWI